MPSLKAIREVIPSAEAMVGRVVAFHEGKHIDLGDYHGDDAVALNLRAEQLIAGIVDARKEAVEAEKTAAAQAASTPKAKRGKPQPQTDADELSAGLDGVAG